MPPTFVLRLLEKLNSWAQLLPGRSIWWMLEKCLILQNWLSCQLLDLFQHMPMCLESLFNALVVAPLGQQSSTWVPSPWWTSLSAWEKSTFKLWLKQISPAQTCTHCWDWDSFAAIWLPPRQKFKMVLPGCWASLMSSHAKPKKWHLHWKIWRREWQLLGEKLCPALPKQVLSKPLEDFKSDLCCTSSRRKNQVVKVSPMALWMRSWNFSTKSWRAIKLMWLLPASSASGGSVPQALTMDQAKDPMFLASLKLKLEVDEVCTHKNHPGKLFKILKVDGNGVQIKYQDPVTSYEEVIDVPQGEVLEMIKNAKGKIPQMMDPAKLEAAFPNVACHEELAKCQAYMVLMECYNQMDCDSTHIKVLGASRLFAKQAFKKAELVFVPITSSASLLSFSKPKNFEQCPTMVSSEGKILYILPPKVFKEQEGKPSEGVIVPFFLTKYDEEHGNMKHETKEFGEYKLACLVNSKAIAKGEEILACSRLDGSQPSKKRKLTGKWSYMLIAVLLRLCVVSNFAWSIAMLCFWKISIPAQKPNSAKKEAAESNGVAKADFWFKQQCRFKVIPTCMIWFFQKSSYGQPCTYKSFGSNFIWSKLWFENHGSHLGVGLHSDTWREPQVMEGSSSIHKACRELPLVALVAAESLSPRPCKFALPKYFSSSICFQTGFHQQNALFPKAQLLQPQSFSLAQVLQGMRWTSAIPMSFKPSSWRGISNNLLLMMRFLGMHLQRKKGKSPWMMMTCMAMWLWAINQLRGLLSKKLVSLGRISTFLWYLTSWSCFLTFWPLRGLIALQVVVQSIGEIMRKVANSRPRVPKLQHLMMMLMHPMLVILMKSELCIHIIFFEAPLAHWLKKAESISTKLPHLRTYDALFALLAMYQAVFVGFLLCKLCMFDNSYGILPYTAFLSAFSVAFSSWMCKALLLWNFAANVLFVCLACRLYVYLLLLPPSSHTLLWSHAIGAHDSTRISRSLCLQSKGGCLARGCLCVLEPHWEAWKARGWRC